MAVVDAEWDTDIEAAFVGVLGGLEPAANVSKAIASEPGDESSANGSNDAMSHGVSSRDCITVCTCCFLIFDFASGRDDRARSKSLLIAVLKMGLRSRVRGPTFCLVFRIGDWLRLRQDRLAYELVIRLSPAVRKNGIPCFRRAIPLDLETLLRQTVDDFLWHPRSTLTRAGVQAPGIAVSFSITSFLA